MNEFELIKHYFQKQTFHRPDVMNTIGDDCAILKVPDQHQLAVSIDTLVSGIHFFPDMPAEDLGYKALSINLSDLAAAGAEPAWFTLALTLPTADETWLENFSRGLFTLANQYRMQLIGGDTTHGPLAITIQAHGFVPTDEALTRSGARPGDEIYVTGTLGDAGFGLNLLKNKFHSPDEDFFISRFYRPTARIDAGIALRRIASAAIDISDGIAADLSHILERSNVGATIFTDKLPRSPALRATHDAHWQEYALTSGEDYELCFTVSPANTNFLEQAFIKSDCPFTHIGTIEQAPGLRILDEHHHPIHLAKLGYNHFE